MLMLYMALIDDDADKDLFEVLYTKYSADMIRYAASVLTAKYQSYSEDVVQEAYISLAKNMKVVQNIDCSKRKAFLVTIVKNKAIDTLRKQNGAEIPLDDIEHSVESNSAAPIDVLISKDGYSHLKDCIAGLDESYRVVLEMKLYYKLSNEEIGKILGITTKNAEMRVYRGRAKLKEILRKESDEQ